MFKGGLIMRQNLTSLRRMTVIQILSDTKKWNTQDLIKRINEVQKDYLEDESDKFKPIKLKNINNATISPILRDLREKGIIETETIPKEEKKGRGPGGDRHWLIKDISVFFRIIKESTSIIPGFDITITRISPAFFISREFYKFGIEFINSEYGKSFINQEIIQMFERSGGMKFSEERSKIVLKIIETFPSAIICGIISTATMISYEKSQSLNLSPEDKEGLFLLDLYECLTYDITRFSLYPSIPFKYETTFQICPEKELNQNTTYNLDLTVDDEKNEIKTVLKFI